MGLFDFAADIGNKLFGKEEEGGEKIKAHIEEFNPGVDDLEVKVKDGVAELKGYCQKSVRMAKINTHGGQRFRYKQSQRG